LKRDLIKIGESGPLFVHGHAEGIEFRSIWLQALLAD
jgi:hypothetical protein